MENSPITREHEPDPEKPGIGLKLRRTGGTRNYPVFSVICGPHLWARVSGQFKIADVVNVAHSIGMTYAQLGALCEVLDCSENDWQEWATRVGIDVLL
jgi:hypothetical protein